MDSTKGRLWLVFFAEPPGPSWWAWLLRPGFRHCYAVSWYADQERWVEFNPTTTGAVILLWREEEFAARLAVLLGQSAAVLRVASRADRLAAPPFAFCTGSVKALLGLRSFAVTPYQLYRDLLGRGAEVVVTPCVAAPPEAAVRSPA